MHTYIRACTQGGKGGCEDPIKRAERLGSELTELRIHYKALESKYEALKKEKDDDVKRCVRAVICVCVHRLCMRRKKNMMM